LKLGEFQIETFYFETKLEITLYTKNFYGAGLLFFDKNFFIWLWYGYGLEINKKNCIKIFDTHFSISFSKSHVIQQITFIILCFVYWVYHVSKNPFVQSYLTLFHHYWYNIQDKKFVFGLILHVFILNCLFYTNVGKILTNFQIFSSGIQKFSNEKREISGKISMIC
jgi:hypothetical protein